MDIDQVVEVCRHWQKPASWYMLFEVSAFRQEAVREYFKETTPETQSRLHRSSEILKRHTDSMDSLGDWIRLNRPDLIAEIPILDWTAQEREHIHEYCRAMQRIEAGILSSVVIPDAAEPKVEKPPAQSKQRNKTNKRWTVIDVEERIRLELNSSDPATHEKYLFASPDELESLIGCNRKTAMKTTFWTEHRDELQKAWRRKNTKGDRPLKQDL